MKYHFLYRITNTLNGKFYIGVHSTDEIEDGYMGSGSLLKAEIKQFGVENFEREIIAHFQERSEAMLAEAQYVTVDFLKNPLTYNLVCGGGKGVKTVKEKAIYFNRNKVRSLKYKEQPFERLDAETKTVFTLKTPVKIDRFKTEIRNVIASFIEARQDELMQTITELYNNKFTHEYAKKALKNIHSHLGFFNNIKAEAKSWETANSAVINL